MLSTIVYSKSQWTEIWKNVQSANPPSINLSWVMEKKLGLTVVPAHGQVRAVFKNENTKTMFILKYT